MATPSLNACFLHAACKTSNLRSRRSLPPIEATRSNGGDFWTLFGKYISHILTEPSDGFHPISAAWHSVIQSANSDIEGQALAAAIAVEALVKLIDETATEEKAEFVRPGCSAFAEWIEKTFPFLMASGCPPKIQGRIRGVF